MDPAESSAGTDAEGDEAADSTPDPDGGHPTVERPQPPDNLPNYLVDPLTRQGLARLKDTADFVEALIAYHEKIEERKLDAPEALPDDSEAVIEDGQRVWYNEELRSCNDTSCKCSSGSEDDLHGPYKYRYYRGEEGEMKSEYVGVVDDGDE